MLLRFICCDVFTRIACSAIARSENIIDVEFVPMLAHTHPNELREDLQRRLDTNPTGRDYDAVLLGYGLCGNSTAGLTADIPIIMPRVHDCCTMLLGSRERFQAEFGDALSTRWCSNGYYERCYITGESDTLFDDGAYKTNPEFLKLVEEHGEENADYVWEIMHPDIETDDSIYIRMNGFEFSDSARKYKELMDEKGKLLRTVEGDDGMMRRLCDGPWDEREFLTVPAGKKIAAVYDLENVVSAE